MMSGAVRTSSGSASIFRISYAAVPGTSPWLGLPGSTLSTTVFGIGKPPGVEGGASCSSDASSLRISLSV